MTPETLTISEAKYKLESLDLLVRLEREGIEDAAIAIGGGANACHIGTAIWGNFGGILECFILDTKQKKGCRLMRWEDWAKENHPVIVRRLIPEVSEKINLSAAIREGLSHLGEPYGWNLIHRFFWSACAVVRWFVRPIRNNGKPYKGFHVCSTLHAAIMEAGGLDTVKYRANESTTPGDLLMSAVYETIYKIKV